MDKHKEGNKNELHAHPPSGNNQSVSAGAFFFTPLPLTSRIHTSHFKSSPTSSIMSPKILDGGLFPFVLFTAFVKSPKYVTTTTSIGGRRFVPASRPRDLSSVGAATRHLGGPRRSSSPEVFLPQRPAEWTYFVSEAKGKVWHE